IGGLPRFDPAVVAPAVAVAVEYMRRPPLRRRGIAGLVELLRVEPADHLPTAAGPQRVVRIVIRELQVVRAVAGVDESVFLRLRLIDRKLPSRTFDRENPGRGMIRAALAERGIVRGADACGVPDAAPGIEHRVVRIRAAVPD